MNQSTKTRGLSSVVLPLPLAPITAITLLTRSPVGLVAIQLSTTFSPTWWTPQFAAETIGSWRRCNCEA